MFQQGDRIRLARRANQRFGYIDRVEDDGRTVIGTFDDGLGFIRSDAMLADLVLLLPVRQLIQR